ncbi:uncharacterized protein EI90DRAFT_3158694 [Cantharellus anzutake]|uniref:uncharacterized protein n=1 Tax=Cantharellus anzutake TaxID=1750568 RepID=UPI001906CD96|nr:uncharacterized protein EI90DRAFT_3158694 [Cantharellus anzutake]KAF8317766.1 hypothetical protein EI90DRAFT_3158694 [Cantharellus anzutake]
MPIAPIVGKLRKRLIVDLTAGIGLGTASAFGYWYWVKVPAVRREEAFYIKYTADRAAAAGASSSS